MATYYRTKASSFSGTNCIRESILRSSQRKRSSSCDRYKFKSTSTIDRDESYHWGPLIRKIPLSTHLQLNKIETEFTIDRLLMTFNRQRYLTQKLKDWRIDMHDDDNDDDNNDNNNDDDNLDATLQKLLQIISTKKCVFKCFEEISLENANLGARIAESCLIGLQKAILDYGTWKFL